MHGTNKVPIIANDIKAGQTSFKFRSAFIIVSNTGHASGVSDLFNQGTCHGGRKCFGFSAAWPSNNYAVAGVCGRSVLLSVR